MKTQTTKVAAMVKMLLIAGAVTFLFSFQSRGQNAANNNQPVLRDAIVVDLKNQQDWSREITYEKMFGDVESLTVLNSWETIADRISLINQALQSPSLASVQQEQFTTFKTKLLALEIKLLDGALTDKMMELSDKDAESKRIESIKKEKNAVMATINKTK